jgi:cytidylate kinase
MSSRKITIAVDGYSACGKSTLARALANQLNYKYVDTGAMYRSITLYAIRNGLINGKKLDVDSLNEQLDDIDIKFEFNEDSKSSMILLNDENVEDQIRQMDVNDWVSQVSAVPEVRRKMVTLQQKMGKEKGIAMDGRDIGTTVFPDAELKLFMTAEIGVRTNRRLSEMKAKNIAGDFEQVKANLLQRDKEDMSRKGSPLRKADNAIILDNSNLTRDEQLNFALSKAFELISKQ